MLDFYKTKAGRMFFDSHIPQLVVALKDIARELGNKHAYSASSKDLDSPLIGSTMPNESIVVFKGEFANCGIIISRWTRLHESRYDTSKVLESYYIFIDGQSLRSPATDGSYGTLLEAFEAIANELS